MEHILLIGHGSPRKEANNIDLIANVLHNTIHPECDSGCVKIAYLQFAEPDITAAIKECIAGGASRIIVHPFFLSPGMHVTKDIPAILSEARATYPGVEFIYTEPLGMHEKLVQIVIDRINAVKFEAPEDIEQRSFEIIGDEVDLADLPPEQIPIVKRVIHATADFEFRRTLVFSPDAVETGLAVIRAGANILTDVEMVRTGINKRLLDKWGGKVICNITDEDVAGTSSKSGRTRAEIAMEKGLSGTAGNVGIVAIGNAPTALLKVIELLAKEFPQGPTPLVIGVPVGFVKALESKMLLSAQKFPFITNLSRKGGTPVAVAIVNALLRMAEEK
jgi:precorrin-8X/cobalt-precorrin-8 methylmutase